MELAFVFIGLPVVSYLALASLPRSWPALIGIAVAALVTAALWAAFGIGSSDSYLTAVIGFLSAATALAAIVQVIRQTTGAGSPSWVYPSRVGIALLAAGIPMLTILGV